MTVLSLLDELDQLGADTETPPAPGVAGVGSVAAPARQCSPCVLLGGAATSLGPSSPSQPRACPSLLCLGCNLPVIRLDNLRWHEDTDYLFLRNNVPDIKKLRGNMKHTGCPRKVWFPTLRSFFPVTFIPYIQNTNYSLISN